MSERVLPEGWQKLPFLETCQQISVTGKKLKASAYQVAGQYRVVDQGQETVSGFSDNESLVVELQTPVVVFGDHTRIVKWVPWSFVPGADGIKVLSPVKGLCPRFFYHQLSAIELPDKGYSRHFKFLKECEVLIPPLEEQKALADKLDELLAQVNNLEVRLGAIPAILKRFRQSVLSAAVRGKLTERWRVSSAFTSIGETIEECKGLINKRVLKLACKELRPDEVRLDVPSSWQWVRLSRVAEVVSGIAKGSKTNKGLVEVPYLRVANVQRGYLDLREVKSISVPADKAEALCLQDGDILFNEGGDIDKLGRGWVWEGQIDGCIHQNHVFRARCFLRDFESKYISCYGNSEGRSYFLREGTQSVNLANINKTTLSLLPIPLPPIEEQAEIVRRVDQLFAFADQIEQQVANAQARVNKLTQSILVKAFRGELTAEWRVANPELISGEHSAEALLERIKAEKAKQNPASKSRKKKTAETAG